MVKAHNNLTSKIIQKKYEYRRSIKTNTKIWNVRLILLRIACIWDYWGKPYAISEFFLGMLIQCHILLLANEKRLNHLFHSRIILALEIMVVPLFKRLFYLLLNESNCIVLWRRSATGAYVSFEKRAYLCSGDEEWKPMLAISLHFNLSHYNFSCGNQ